MNSKTKELILEQRREINRTRSSEFYRNNRESILESRKVKILCDCGKMVTKASIKRHCRALAHKRIIENGGIIILQ